MPGFKAAGHRIISVASRGGESARALAGATGADWRRDLSVPDNCDILILAVTDTSVAGLPGRSFFRTGR